MNKMMLIVIIVLALLIGGVIGYYLSPKPTAVVVNKVEYFENKEKIDSLSKKVVDLKYELKKEKDKLPDITNKDSLKTKSREFLVDSIITPMERIGITKVEIIQTQELKINYLEQNNEILENENKELVQDVIKEKRLKNIFKGATVITTIVILLLI